MNVIKRNADILLILLIGFSLRMIGVVLHSYSNDELSAVSRLRYDNFSDLIEFGVQKGDMHPAGVQIFMKGWSALFGSSEIAMRLPFVLLATASILLLFLIGKTWFNRRVGLIAAGLLAVLYFPLINTEFARPYSPGLFFVLFTSYHFFRLLLEGKTNVKTIALLAIGFSGAMYSHYFAFFFVLFMGFTGLFLLKKNTWKAYLLSAGIGALLFVPHIPVTIYHLSRGGLQWLAPPDPDWLAQFLFHAFNESWVVISTLFILVIFGWRKLQKSMLPYKKPVLLVLLWFFGIYLIGHAYSFVGTPILKFPVMLFAFPFFLLLLAIPISAIPSNKVVLFGLLLVVGVSTFQERHYHKNIHFALFKEPGLKMAEWRNKYGSENIYTIYNLNNPNYINFYKNEWGGVPLQFDWSTIEFDDSYAIYEDLRKSQSTFCVIGFSSRLTLVQVFESALYFYPEVVDYQRYNNGSIFLLKRSNLKTIDREEILLARFDENPKFGHWEFDPAQKQAVGQNSSHYLLTETYAVGPSYQFTKAEIPITTDGYLLVQTCADLPVDAGLTVTFTASSGGEAIMHREKPVWIGHNIEQMILTNESKQGFFAFKIPPFIEDSDDLKIQFWNRTGHDIALWDIKVWWIENIWNSDWKP